MCQCQLMMHIFRNVSGTQAFDSTNDFLNNTDDETQYIGSVPAAIDNQPSQTRCMTSGLMVSGKPSPLYSATNSLAVSGNPSTSQSLIIGTSASGKPPTSHGIANGLLTPHPARNSSEKENKSGKNQPKPMRRASHVHLKLLPPDKFPINTARAPLGPLCQQNADIIERPVRKSSLITRMNYNILVCCVCKKKVQINDSLTQCNDGGDGDNGDGDNGDDGNIICSIECFKKS